MTVFYGIRYSLFVVLLGSVVVGNVSGADWNSDTPMLNSTLPMLAERGTVRYTRSTFDRMRYIGDTPVGYSRVPTGSSFGTDQIGCGIWFEGFGDFLRQDDTDAVQGYKADAVGFNLGLDTQVAKKLFLGLGFGCSDADVDSNDRAQSGQLDQYLFQMYGSYRQNDWYTSCALGYAFNNYDITRTPGGTSFTSSHDANQASASFELAKKYRLGNAFMMPFFALDYIHLTENSYCERNPQQVASYFIEGRDSDVCLQTLGVRFGKNFKARNGWLFNPMMTVGWVHDYGDESTFIVNGSAMPIRGVSMNRDRALIGLALNAKSSKRTTLFARYDGEFADNFSAQSVQAGMTYMY